MEYKRLTRKEVESLAVGAQLNLGHGKIYTLVGFGESTFTFTRPGETKPEHEKLYILRAEDGEEHRWAWVVLAGATMETMDVTVGKCEYCGRLRPKAELKEVDIRVNHAWRREIFCADDHCAAYRQMGAEG